MAAPSAVPGDRRFRRLAIVAAACALCMILSGPVVRAQETPEAAPPAEAPAADSVAEGPEAAEPVLDFSDWLRGALGDWVLYRFLGVAVWQFVCAFAFLLAGFVVKKVSDFIFEKRLIPLLEKTPFRFDNLLATAASKPLGYLFLLAGVAAAFGVMTLPQEPNVRGFVFGALKVLLGADLVWFLFRVVDVAVAYLARLAGRTESKLDDQVVPLLRKALKVTIGIVCGLWVVQLLGYSVSSLLAGLGIGGLAVALALQDSLSNFFGSVAIFLDRPFRVGDMVRIGDVEGTVEEIGFRSTRIRTWPVTLVAIPNRKVADATIDNWSKMPKRRVKQVVGVTYETTADQMERAVGGVRKILENDEGVDQEFMVVRFAGFGDSSLDIQVIYFTKDIAYADHMATRERVNLAVMRAIERLGLSIAFPTRTVYFEGDVAKQMAGRPSGGSAKG